jgi:hypothetical protein
LNKKYYDALEICLRDMQAGADLETCLRRFPDLADELRPALEASLAARTLTLKALPAAAIQQRGRARLLQHAAEMRESQRAINGRSIRSLRMVAVSLVLVAIFLMSGTGLVRASSGALPGDQLYPVKRTWEDVRLWFVFNPEAREQLESKYERERIDEIDELFAEGRNAQVAFSGVVKLQNPDRWLVSGVSVGITSQTQLPSEPIGLNANVMVSGHTNASGYIDADSIQLLPPGAIVPLNEPEDHNDSGDKGSEDASIPSINSTEKPTQPESGQDQSDDETGSSKSGDNNAGSSLLTSRVQGSVQSKQGSIWTINGKRVDTSYLENINKIPLGASVKVEGYFTANGQFVASSLEIVSSSEAGGGSESNKSGSSTSVEDHSDSHEDGTPVPEPTESPEPKD